MTTTPTTEQVHHGRNIKRLREMLGIKQEALALSLGEDWSQKKVSRLEEKELIEDELLQEVGKALHVSADVIKNFDEEKAINIFSNTYNDNSSILGTYHFNPIDKIVSLYDEKMELYERIIKDKNNMIEKLEKLLQERK